MGQGFSRMLNTVSPEITKTPTPQHLSLNNSKVMIREENSKGLFLHYKVIVDIREIINKI